MDVIWVVLLVGLIVVAFGMILWKRWQRRLARAATPDWARLFTPSQYRAFNSAVELSLAELGLEAAHRAGVVAAALPDGRPLRFGLQNLAQQCRTVERERWPELITTHFRAVMNAEQEALSFDKTDFAAVRELLKVRVMPSEAVEQGEELSVVRRPVADGLSAVLVYDLPNTVASVLPEDVAVWDRSEDELFALGLENARTDPGIEADRVEVERGVVLRALEGPSFFVATHLLLLDRQLPQKLPYGALVCAPTRHLLLFHAIRDSRVLVAINALIPQSYLHYHQGPGSLSPNLYWWHEGELTLLPTELGHDEVKFTPPSSFVEQVMTPIAKE